MKYINKLEHLQWQATKFILDEYISDYKTRLLKLKLLPLMHIFELSDITNLSNVQLTALTSLISNPFPAVLDQEASSYITILPTPKSIDIFILLGFAIYGMPYHQLTSLYLYNPSRTKSSPTSGVISLAFLTLCSLTNSLPSQCISRQFSVKFSELCDSYVLFM